MTERRESLDLLLDEFLRAWHAGEAPDAAAFVQRAADADRDELEQLLGAFAEVAPTVEPAPERAAQLTADEQVARLSAIEAGWWRAQGRDASADQIEQLAAALVGEGGGAGTDEAPWGERLRALREAAGLSLAGLAASFAAQFALSDADAARAPEVIGALESGDAPATGVAARAARALEELLRAPAGALGTGGLPPVANVLLRAAMPEDRDQREEFSQLLRDVDDALEQAAPGEAPGETLRSLLGG